MDSRAGRHGDIRPDRERGFLREPQSDLRRDPKWDSDEDVRGDSRGDFDGDLQATSGESGGPSMEDASRFDMIWT